MRAPENAPIEQQRKIAAYNELVEVIYIHKIELESLEGDLADMKADIESEIEYLALKDAGGTGLETEESGSETTVVVSSMNLGSQVQEDEMNTSDTDPDAAINIAEVTTSLKNVVSITKSTKSRGKGKGRQEKAKLNGMYFKYHRGRQISLCDYDYVYGDEEERYYGGRDRRSTEA